MKKTLLAGLSATLLAGCAPTSIHGPADIVPYRSAANPEQGIRPQHPGNIIDGYTHRTPTNPEEWRRLNEQQTSTFGTGL